MNLYKYFIIGMLILVVMPVVGCSNSSLDLEAELVTLQKTCAVSEEVRSYCMEGSFTYIEEGKTSESTLEMEFVAPDRYHSQGYMDGQWEESIIIGDKVYSRDSDNDKWQEVEVSPNVLKARKLSLETSIPSAEKTLQLLDSLTDLEKLPDELVDGVDCLHCRGRVDMDREVEKRKAEMRTALNPSDPGYQEKLESQELMLEWQRKWKIEYELWISREDCLVRQQKYDMQIPAMESPSGEIMQGEVKSAMLMHHYDINEPLNIQPP